MPRFQSRLSFSLNGLIITVCWLLITASPSSSQISDPIPPVIIDGPPLYKIFNSKGMTSLPCSAVGTTPLTYEWYRNGVLLEPNSKIQIGKDGGLNLNEPDEGYYQCIAKNVAGVGVSNITFLQAAVFEDTNKRPSRVYVVREAFQSLVMPCNHIIRSIPAPRIEWKYEDERPVPLSSRVVVTDSGDLVFTFLFPNDSNHDNNSFYRCIAYNSETRREIGGSYFHLKVKESDVQNLNEAPQLLYSSSDTIRILEGQPFSLSCVFGGVNMSTTGALWQLPNKTILPPTWRLDLPNAKLSDQGNYTCYIVGGRNPVIHTTAKVIKVLVDAFPRLEAPLQGLRVQRGSTALFICRNFGRPTPTVSWIINGTLYNTTEYNSTQYSGIQYQDPSRHDDILVLRDVQNSASVACNVSNKHGYQLSSAYLIVGDAVATTTSSQGRDDLTPSSPGVASTPAKLTKATAEGSSTQSTVKTRPSTGSGKVASTSTNDEIDKKEQKNVSDTAPAEPPSFLVPVIIVVAIVLVIITVASSLALYRRRKQNQSYSLTVQESVQLRLKNENKEQDATCDSDDSAMIGS